jgi:hypothetical protein
VTAAGEAALDGARQPVEKHAAMWSVSSVRWGGDSTAAVSGWVGWSVHRCARRRVVGAVSGLLCHWGIGAAGPPPWFVYRLSPHDVPLVSVLIELGMLGGTALSSTTALNWGQRRTTWVAG